MSSTEYTVQLEIYRGPMDLLLYLVRRHELDVMNLPIAAVTEQFFEFLEALKLLDVNAVGEFLVTASSLLEIKSRMALPQADDEESADEAADDPRGDLVARLLEYKKYKDAARALDEQASAWRERYPRLSDDRPGGGKDPSADRIKEVELWDLVSALVRVLKKKKEIEQTAHIRYDDTPISVYIKRISTRVKREGRTPFSGFFDGTNERPRIIATFLAVLELLRSHGFRAEQPMEFGEIWILPPTTHSGIEPSSAA